MKRNKYKQFLLKIFLGTKTFKDKVRRSVNISRVSGCEDEKSTRCSAEESCGSSGRPGLSHLQGQGGPQSGGGG